MAGSRTDGRKHNELRKVEITRGYTDYADGSVLMEMGQTRVLCTAFVDKNLPSWREGSGLGWATAEYRMLPSSTYPRKRRREKTLDGRSQEIQRLIGRSLRAVLDMEKLGGNMIWIDCDVLQADGGTRTAAITGSFVAMSDAAGRAVENGVIANNPVNGYIAAISAGIVGGKPVLDLNYAEDSRADVDFNVVMTNKKRFVEIQGTGEGNTFAQEEMDKLMKLATSGINKLITMQRRALKERRK